MQQWSRKHILYKNRQRRQSLLSTSTSIPAATRPSIG
jgi:hypothetical protein